MNEINGDKSYIDNLLKALSVNDAMDSFTIIDNLILDLLKCSSEDFLTLNDHFKNYHKESKTISQNANCILEILADYKSGTNFSQLKKYVKEFNKLTSSFTNQINITDTEIKKTTNKLENLRIANSNYKQDLSSIRILIAGSASLSNEGLSAEEIQTIHSKVENIKTQFALSENSIQDYISFATENCLFFTNLKKDNFEQLQSLEEKIDFSLTLFEKKLEEAALTYPSLKTLTEKNTSNIAAIITNLQYHDIIRQKIEHIQRTHKDIMNELKSFANEDESVSLIHNKAKTFLKIRDVAGLQAAQLLHANKQYQNAIEEIGKSLESIGNDMISISSTCDNLTGSSEHNKTSYFNEVISYLKSTLDYTFKFANLTSEIVKRLHLLAEKETKISEFILKIKTEKNTIVEVLNKVNTVPETNKQTISQLKQLIDDTDLLEVHINEIHKELSSNLSKLENMDSSVNQGTGILAQLEELNSLAPQLIELLTNNTQKVDDYLYLNSSISSKISNNIAHSLVNIKYYELFESSCDKIVEELNAINAKLNYGSENANQSRIENLKNLKARYTMASEHIIHDQVTRMHNITELTETNTEKIIDLASQNSDQDDDNLELF